MSASDPIDFDPQNPPAPPTPKLLTADDIKNNYIFGLPIAAGVFATTCEGLPQGVFDRAIKAAYAWIETELGITLLPKNFNDRADYKRDDYIAWAYINLYHKPVIKVNMIQAVFPTATEGTGLIFPIEWVKLYKSSGQINLVPSSGTVANFIIGSSGAFLPAVFSGAWDYLPQLFSIWYVAGFTEIPADIEELIGYKVANEILAIISDILYPPGSQSISLGIDGVSQSLSLTRSQLLFQSRINFYQQQIKERLNNLRNRYMGYPFSVG